MPTLLVHSYRPDFQGRPDRMTGEDFALWKRWKVKGLAGAMKMHFDTHVGDGEKVPPGTDAKMADMWYHVTCKRIDAIIEYQSHIKLIEFRIYASSSAVGRLLMYFKLWNQDPVISKPVKLLLVTQILDPEVASMAIDFDIDYLAV